MIENQVSCFWDNVIFAIQSATSSVLSQLISAGKVSRLLSFFNNQRLMDSLPTYQLKDSRSPLVDWSTCRKQSQLAELLTMEVRRLHDVLSGHYLLTKIDAKPKSRIVFNIVDTAGGYRSAGGRTSWDAWPRSRPTVRPACGWCLNTVVIVAFRQQPRLLWMNCPSSKMGCSGWYRVRRPWRVCRRRSQLISTSLFVHTIHDRYRRLCRRSLHQSRAVDIVEQGSQMVVCRSGDDYKYFTRPRVGKLARHELTCYSNISPSVKLI